LNYGNPLNLEGHLRRSGTAVLRRSTVREDRVGEKSARLNISETRLNLGVGIALIASSALNYGNPLNLEGHFPRSGTAVRR